MSYLIVLIAGIGSGMAGAVFATPGDQPLPAVIGGTLIGIAIGLSVIYEASRS